MLPPFPSLPGTYAMIFQARAPVTAQAGALGSLRFEPGWYIYVGSAFGPGGLRGRLAHHLQPRPQRWHVDALKAVAPIHAIWFTTHSEKLEHHWAQAWMGLPGVRVPWDGFGASDCRCRAHLFSNPLEPLLRVFAERFQAMYPRCPAAISVAALSMALDEPISG